MKHSIILAIAMLLSFQVSAQKVIYKIESFGVGINRAPTKLQPSAGTIEIEPYKIGIFHEGTRQGIELKTERPERVNNREAMVWQGFDSDGDKCILVLYWSEGSQYLSWIYNDIHVLFLITKINK